MSGLIRGDRLRKDLASGDYGKGAELVIFKQGGAEAGNRSVNSVLDEEIRVTNYSDLVFTATAKDPGDGNSHVAITFQSWRLAIQAAFDEAYARGGGTVILPARATPYMVDDYVTCKANTIFCCVGEIKLADYTTVGGTFLAAGDNISVFGLNLDNSNIFAGGSGQNGIAAGHGKNVKFYGGSVKNCNRGEDFVTPGSPNDGGKGIQIESGDGENIVVDGMSFSNCFMAMSTIRDSVEMPSPYCGIVYNNITADNCDILFLVRQVNMNSTTGLQHTVQLNNFYAVNCGAFEGVFQFSRASNVVVTNGVVVNDPAVATTSLIRGNHRNCVFNNVAFYGNTDSIINLDPGTYSPDSSYQPENNQYGINHWGTVNFIANAGGSTAYPTLKSCAGRFQLQNDVDTGFFGYELRNGASTFEVTQGQKTATITTIGNWHPYTSVYKFSHLAIGFSLPSVQTNGVRFPATQLASDYASTLDDYKEGEWEIGLTFGGSSTGITFATKLAKLTKIGNVVFWSFMLELSNKGSATGNAVITGLPFASAGWPNTFNVSRLEIVGNTTPFSASVGIGSTNINLRNIGGAELTNSNFTNNSYLSANGFYFSE